FRIGEQHRALPFAQGRIGQIQAVRAPVLRDTHGKGAYAAQLVGAATRRRSSVGHQLPWPSTASRKAGRTSSRYTSAAAMATMAISGNSRPTKNVKNSAPPVSSNQPPLGMLPTTGNASARWVRQLTKAI